MPLAALLQFPTDDWARNFFEFEHAMAHRANLLVMSPLTRFSVIPYFYEPMANLGNWHQNHQQAHDDALITTPTLYLNLDTTTTFHRINVVDNNLDIPRSLTWWTFINHMNHYTTEGAILPIPQEPIPPTAPPYIVNPW